MIIDLASGPHWVCIAWRYHTSAELLSRLPDFEKSPLPSRADRGGIVVSIPSWPETTRREPVTYHRVRQHVYDRHHILWYARHTRVSAAFRLCCWMRAPTGIRDVQAHKRICQDFRDCSKCTSRFRILIVSICSLSSAQPTCVCCIHTCIQVFVCEDIWWHLSAMFVLLTIKSRVMSSSAIWNSFFEWDIYYARSRIYKNIKYNFWYINKYIKASFFRHLSSKMFLIIVSIIVSLSIYFCVMGDFFLWLGFFFIMTSIISNLPWRSNYQSSFNSIPW